MHNLAHYLLELVDLTLPGQLTQKVSHDDTLVVFVLEQVSERTEQIGGRRHRRSPPGTGLGNVPQDLRRPPQEERRGVAGFPREVRTQHLPRAEKEGGMPKDNTTYARTRTYNELREYRVKERSCGESTTSTDTRRRNKPIEVSMDIILCLGVCVFLWWVFCVGGLAGCARATVSGTSRDSACPPGEREMNPR